jgi:hypothetical protein
MKLRQDLKVLAENVLREYLLKVAKESIATELMDDDPECQLLTDDEYDVVMNMVANAKVEVKVIAR